MLQRGSLQPATLQQDRFTKTIHRLLNGGFLMVAGMLMPASQSPVLPRTQRAYETRLSAGSTAIQMRRAEFGVRNSEVRIETVGGYPFHSALRTLHSAF
jgi:hypothetical protein